MGGSDPIITFANCPDMHARPAWLRPILVAFALAPAVLATGQRTYHDGFFSWSSLQVNMTVADRWRILPDASVRRLDGVGAPVTSTARLGVERAWKTNWTAAAGYAFFRSYPYAPFANSSVVDEHRAWEQVQHLTGPGRWRWRNRLRMEHRLIDHLGKTDGMVVVDGSDLVHRYRLKSQLERRLGSGSRPNWKVFGFCEPMLRTSGDVELSLVDQLRVGLGGGRRTGPHLEVFGNWMFQWLVRGNGDRIERNHWIMFTAVLDIDLSRKAAEP